MKKHDATRRLAAAMVALALLLSGVACFAEAGEGSGDELTPTPRSDAFFNSYSISLSPPSSNTIHISFNVTAKQTSDILGCTTYYVQRYNVDDKKWETVTDPEISGSLGSDTASHAFSRNYTCVRGYKYRVRARYYCKKYDGTDNSVIYTSGSITMN